jgi:hypothetical protein
LVDSLHRLVVGRKHAVLEPVREEPVKKFVEGFR